MAELPPPAVPAVLDPPIVETRGNSHADLLAELTALASEIGYTVKICDTGAAEGICRRERKVIEIAERLEPNGRLAAGVHELAHALVGVDGVAPELTYAEEELVVESVAYCVCQTVGLRTDANSIPYLASWAEEAGLEVLERAAALNARLADRIEAALIVNTPAADAAG